jgi:hypothetical protein
MANFSDAEALEYADEHLIYEVGTLRVCRDVLANGPPQVLKNSMIESYAIHLRNLIDFLYPQNTQATDVTFRDYIPKTLKWSPSKVTASLRMARDMANRQIAHLTTHRFPGIHPGKRWELSRADEVQERLKDFAEKADPGRLSEKVRNFLSPGTS